MSRFSRDRKKNIRRFKSTYLKEAYPYRNYFVWEVHERPIKSEDLEVFKHMSFDAWIFTGKDVFLLQLINSDKLSLKFYRMDRESSLTGSASFPFDFPMDELIKKLLDQVEKFGIPYRVTRPFLRNYKLSLEA